MIIYSDKNTYFRDSLCVFQRKSYIFSLTGVFHAKREEKRGEIYRIRGSKTQ